MIMFENYSGGNSERVWNFGGRMDGFEDILVPSGKIRGLSERCGLRAEEILYSKGMIAQGRKLLSSLLSKFLLKLMIN